MPSSFTRDEMKDAIRDVLRGSYHRRARPKERAFMTAYQVLSFLDDKTRTHLSTTAGRSGLCAGWYHSGAKAVAKMLVEMEKAQEVEIVVLDVRRLTLDLRGQGPLLPGSRYGCGLYRLIDPKTKP